MEQRGMTWRKASYSTSQGGGCVEVGVWRKASYSGSNGGGCIEVASTKARVAIRDSKDPDGPKLTFTAEDWRQFTHQLKGGSPGPS
jgi:hypothetical protein